MAEQTNVALYNISQANNVFTFDMYKILAEEPGNLFFSPLSIQVILALTFLGARGNTAQQIARGLRISDDPTVVEDGFEAIMNKFQNNNDVLLDLANKIYLKDGFSIKEGFNQSAIRLKAGVEKVDFSNEPEARKTINDWVESKTNNRIQDIIPSGVLSELTRVVLVNAIYFKGDWLKQFEKNATRPLPFHSASGSTETVDMMYIKAEFKYRQICDLKSQVLLLPYKGERLSMIVFLPRKVNGLANLEKKLSNLNLQDIIKKMHNTSVHVYLPKFTMEYSEELTEPLKTLGMTDMFDSSASDLSGITDEEQLTVSRILHKSFVEVTEEGTEAAAATDELLKWSLPNIANELKLLFDELWNTETMPEERKVALMHPLHKKAVVIGVTSVARPIIFKADHPFVFLIWDHQTKTVLFAGRYSDPPSTS